jgi:hypothetical protein
MPLNPSERVLLMKEIADRVSAESWPLIDVTLRQFSLPWSDEWRGEKDAYVLKMIENGSDQTLIDLAAHAGFRLSTQVTGIDPPFWRPRLFRLFLSHLAAHCGVASQLQESLLPFGISAFVAHNDIEPTRDWQTQIETALATCDTLVALLHPDFHLSNWVDQEIGFAMGRGVPVFSVRFGQDPYGFIGRLQAFNGSGNSIDALALGLFTAYRTNKQTEGRMAHVLVTLFAESETFAVAKRRLTYLEQLEVWDTSFSERLESAIANNGQINGAWGVPDRVNVLIKKWGSVAL